MARQSSGPSALLMDELRAAAPDLEIESCASGGARVDLGIIERVDRFWPSDSNDPLERQQIHRWTTVLVPPEYLGSHLGAARAHTTGRTSDLTFRAATAIFGSAGIEWNLLTASQAERLQVAAWAAAYRARRAQLHHGTVVRADGDDPAIALHGVVSADRAHAVFAYVALAAPKAAVPGPARLVGLEADRVYRVRAWDVLGPPAVLQDAPPPWWAAGEVVLPGRVLVEVGLAMPLLLPQQALLLDVDDVTERPAAVDRA